MGQHVRTPPSTPAQRAWTKLRSWAQSSYVVMLFSYLTLARTLSAMWSPQELLSLARNQRPSKMRPKISTRLELRAGSSGSNETRSTDANETRQRGNCSFLKKKQKIIGFQIIPKSNFKVFILNWVLAFVACQNLKLNYGNLIKRGNQESTILVIHI